MKLLIVDDNPQMRQMIRNVVENPGDEIIELSDGSEALKTYAHNKPDWVLMDIKMKIVDGITATRILKNAYPDAHVAIVTQYTDKKFHDEAQSAKADAFVSKENLLELKNIIGKR